MKTNFCLLFEWTLKTIFTVDSFQRTISQFILKLTLRMLVNFACFFSSADFFKISFFKTFLSGIPSKSKSLDPDEARHFVVSDLGPNCLQML